MKGKTFRIVISLLACICVCTLIAFVIFLVKESMPFLNKVPIKDFIFNQKWRPTDIGNSYGIFNIIRATFYIGLLASLISMPIAYGSSVFICFYLKDRVKSLCMWLINLLAGIPSIVYGFFGMFVIVKFIEKTTNISSGESVLSGALILTIMILPFFISIYTESLEIIKNNFLKDSDNLNVSKEYFIRNIVFRSSFSSMIIGFMLALSRALGETMAVMLVIGNAPIEPTLLGKAQTISSLIALEVGMSEVGSLHYGALFSSGLVLLVMNVFINLFVIYVKNLVRRRHI